jgi:hypothetical protein
LTVKPKNPKKWGRTSLRDRDRRFFAAPERCIIYIVGASHKALGLAQNDGLAIGRTVIDR